MMEVFTKIFNGFQLLNFFANMFDYVLNTPLKSTQSYLQKHKVALEILLAIAVGTACCKI